MDRSVWVLFLFLLGCRCFGSADDSACRRPEPPRRPVTRLLLLCLLPRLRLLPQIPSPPGTPRVLLSHVKWAASLQIQMVTVGLELVPESRQYFKYGICLLFPAFCRVHVTPELSVPSRCESQLVMPCSQTVGVRHGPQIVIHSYLLNLDC